MEHKNAVRFRMREDGRDRLIDVFVWPEGPHIGVITKKRDAAQVNPGITQDERLLALLAFQFLIKDEWWASRIVEMPAAPNVYHVRRLDVDTYTKSIQELADELRTDGVTLVEPLKRSPWDRVCFLPEFRQGEFRVSYMRRAAWTAIWTQIGLLKLSDSTLSFTDDCDISNRIFGLIAVSLVPLDELEQGIVTYVRLDSTFLELPLGDLEARVRERGFTIK